MIGALLVPLSFLASAAFLRPERRWGAGGERRSPLGGLVPVAGRAGGSACVAGVARGRGVVDLGMTWVTWACGIALGLAILFLFAMFEKKRNEVLAMVDGLKEWQG